MLYFVSTDKNEVIDVQAHNRTHKSIAEKDGKFIVEVDEQNKYADRGKIYETSDIESL